MKKLEILIRQRTGVQPILEDFLVLRVRVICSGYGASGGNRRKSGIDPTGRSGWWDLAFFD